MCDGKEAFVSLVVWFAKAWFLYYFYSSLASTFDWPRFTYWVAFSAVAVINTILPKFEIKKEN